MKSQLLIVLTLICLILISYNSSLCGGKDNYRVETITIEDGLFVNYAHAIIQDSIGFIWMGSDYGLQNYDAFHFKQYLHDPSDSLSLRSNSVIDLFTDNKKNLWISTSGGLQNYQYQTDNFRSFFFRNENQYTLPFDLYALAQDSSESLYAGINFAPESLYLKHKYIAIEEYTNKGVFHFDPLNGKFTPLEFVNKVLNDVPSKNIIKDISFDKNNLLWVALVPHGIILFDLKNSSYKNFLSSSNNPSTLSNNNVNDIFVDSNGEVWISTEQGLNKYLHDNDSFIRYLQNPLNSNSLQRNNVLKVAENKYGELWVGYSSNYTGISRFNKQSEKFINYTENLYKKSRTLFIDNSGVVWLGSANRGINVIIEFPLKFSTHTIFKDNKNLLQGFANSSIIEDSEGNTWFDGYPGGLYKYDRKSGQYTFYKSVLNKPDNPGSDWIKDIYKDKQGFIWFCTANTINRLDPQKHSFKKYQTNRIDNNTLPVEQISGF